jgi:hypothetical protein
MIEAATARELVERLRQVEDRLGRVLASGWRQARGEAADLRHDADALAEAGLTELAARLMAVAEAGSAGEALPAIALATSACRLLRARLLAEAVPDGWVPLAPPKSRARASVETVLPIARLWLEGREVWACARPTRAGWLLLDPPFPAKQEQPASANADTPSGIFGRLRRQLGQVLGDQASAQTPWLHRRLRGRLIARARYPLGADGQVTRCTIKQPAWVDEPEAHDPFGELRPMLTGSAPLTSPRRYAMLGGIRLLELQRADPSVYAWLDPSGADALRAAPTAKVWGIVWVESQAVVPLALVTPAEHGRPPHLTHLIPGAPSEPLSLPA